MKKVNSLLVLACMLLAQAGCTDKTMDKAQLDAMQSKAAIDNIMQRTSVRTYQQGRAVEREKVDVMLRAAMAAPTAVNKQPWHFVVVDDKMQLDLLAQANGRAPMLKTAPLAIVVCGDKLKAMEGEGQVFWIQDCSAAAENILLAAQAQGLGAVWTALYPFAERYEPVQQALRLPSTLVPLCTIVIGYPDGVQTPKDKFKSENVSYNTYGGK